MRKGMTLIELMVVISLIVVLAGLVVMISPRFAEDQRVSRGADQIQGWLLVQKQRAYRDQVPRGVRLVRASTDPTNPDFNVVREMVYIERPEDLRGEPDLINPANSHNQMRVPSPLQVPAGGPPNSYVLLPGWDVTGMVNGGDWLKMNTWETQPYNLHRVNDVTLTNQGTVLRLAAGDLTPSVILGRIAPGADTRFQIIRGAQPMAGEPTLPLPRDVVVDLDPATVGTSKVNGLDLMFDVRGQMTDAKVILRVRDASKPADYGTQIFVVIHGRTGLITAHPAGPANDPYQFTRDGKDSGM